MKCKWISRLWENKEKKRKEKWKDQEGSETNEDNKFEII